MTPLLTVSGVRKRFGATLALDGVSFDVAAGEVHALVGENGAGKTTLMNVLSGVVQPDAGEILLLGESVAIASPKQAQGLGIATVFQELSLTGAVSIAENIFAGRTPSRFGLVDWPRLTRSANELLAELGVALDVRQPLAAAPVAVRQVVEIAKAISLDARVLLLDEPTAALSPVEAERLFAVIGRLAGRGLGIVYISHHLSEVLRAADRITVLRDGRVVARRKPAETDQDALVRDMAGRAIAGWRRHRVRRERPVLLEARGLSRSGAFRDVSLTIGAGEIVGLAGLIGSFRGELGQTLCGILRPTSGEIRLAGRPVRWTSFAEAVRERVAYMPEDRKVDGLFPDLSVTDNITAASLRKVARHGLYSRSRSARIARSAIAALGIKAPDPAGPVRALSGGNQQKALLARWLETDPRVLIVDEPTRGVDVAAKHEIHAILADLAEAGAGLLVISSDLIELTALADRILVMHAGRIVGELDAQGASEADIVALASGLGAASKGRAA
jgi:ribose transport system ATP-binding protein